MGNPLLGRVFLHRAMIGRAAVFAVLGLSFSPGFAAPEKESPSCVTLLSENSHYKLAANSDDDFGLSLERFSIRDLYADGPNNLVYKHPLIAMNAAQRFAAVLQRDYDHDGQPFVRAIDPLFRTQRIKNWDVFSGVKEADGRSLVGQFRYAEELANYTLARAQGTDVGKPKLAVGPPGTGKTQTLYILALTLSNLARTNPDFYQFGLRWKNLSQVPYLRSAVVKDKESGDERLLNPGLEAPPLVALLRRDMQDHVLHHVSQRAKKMMGALPEPPRNLDPINEFILQKVIEFELEKRGLLSLASVTPAEYIDMLEPYVEIFRFVPKVNQERMIVRYPGENPNMGELFFDAHPVMSFLYPKTPLAWKYGQIPHQSGQGLGVDEFPRYNAELVDLFLEVLENNQITYGGAPSFKGDFFILLTGNVESVKKTRDNHTTGARAIFDRVDPVPVRLNLHPIEAAEVAFAPINRQRIWMRDLRQPGAEWEPADFNQIFTKPDSKGKVEGPTGRYSIKISSDGPDSPTAVLVAPRVAEYLGVVLSATRLVLDRKILDHYAARLSTATHASHWVTDPSRRIMAFLGMDVPPPPIANDLATFSDLAREGMDGITSRASAVWLNAALDLARDIHPEEPTLTPKIMRLAFKSGLDSGKISPDETSKQTSTEWYMLEQLMSQSFLRAWLDQDTAAIENGDPSRVERIYEEVAQEIITLAESSHAASVEVESGDEVRIDRKRWEAIQKIYQAQNNGQSLLPDKAGMAFLKAKQDGTKWAPLFKAVQAWVVDQQQNLIPKSSLISYFKGNSDSLGADVRNRGRQAEVHLSTLGYNRPAILDALELSRDLQEQTKSKKP